MPSRFISDLDIFDEIDQEWKAYFCGWLWSDGWLFKNSIGLRINEFDKCVLEYFNLKISGNRLTLHYRKGKEIVSPSNGKTYQTGNFYSLNIYSLEICESLRKIGLIERKSKTIKFPKFNCFLNAFLRGVFEGDGFFKFKKPTFSKKSAVKTVGIYSGSKDFIEAISFYLLENNINNKVDRVHNGLFAVMLYSHDKILAFYNLIYKDAEFKLPRKYNKFEEYFSWHNNIKRKSLSKEKYIYLNKQTGSWFFKYNKKTTSFDTLQKAVEAKRLFFNTIQ